MEWQLFVHKARGRCNNLIVQVLKCGIQLQCLYKLASRADVSMDLLPMYFVRKQM